jgi:hypothetical protein
MNRIVNAMWLSVSSEEMSEIGRRVVRLEIGRGMLTLVYVNIGVFGEFCSEG